MRISVKRLRAITGLLGLAQVFAFAPPLLASSESDEPNGPPLIAEPTDELDRWIPSLSIAMGLMIQESTAGYLTGEVQGPWVQVFPASPRISPSASGNDRNFAPAASVSIELMSAGLRTIPWFPDIEAPGKPRLFVHGEVIPSFPHAYQPAKTGDVDDFANGFEPGRGINSEEVIFGQGGTLETELQRWQFGAGAGVALTVDFWGRRMRVKPSFEYLTQEVKVSGVIHRAIAQNATPADLNDHRFIVLKGSKTKRFHGMGAGIELELDTRRAGPMLLSIYSNARGYRFMGDLGFRLTERNEFGEGASFQFDLDRYGYSASIGIRVRFAPE